MMMLDTARCRKAGVAVAGPQGMLFRVFHWPSFLALAALLLTLSNSASATGHPDDLEATIQHLITFVRDSNVQFERNFSSHNSVEAAEHIERKYQHFKDKIDTPEKFIELSATASLVTGKKYMVITEQGEEFPAGEWLNTELERYRLQNLQP